LKDFFVGQGECRDAENGQENEMFHHRRLIIIKIDAKSARLIIS
jgi:hypothetical protein